MSKVIRKFYRRETIAFAFLVGTVIALAALFITSPNSSAAGKKTKIDTPAISCAGSTQASINIQVTAPSGANATGLPAGFSLQWITAEAYAAGPDGVPGTTDDNSWPASDGNLCKASFSGNANLSRYNLLPGQSVTVNVGEFLFDEGASTTCGGALVCGTTYVFRAFGHATNTLNRSDFTANLECATLECDNDGGECTLTQGYWKTHTPFVCNTDPTSPLCIQWPTEGLTLGTVAYTNQQLVDILNTPAAGNGLIALAHQLIAAKLNIEAGADGTDAASCIASADALIGGLVIPPVGTGSLSAASTSSLTTCLANYNEGGTGPGHCN
jgi:hypothetical protein